MPTFDTNGPASVRVRLGHGRVSVVASDRADVVVDVEPADPASNGDRAHAEATTVEQRGQRIFVEAPRDPLVGRRRLDIRLEVPNASRLDVVVASADVICSGALGVVTSTTASGDASFEHVESLEARTSSGDTTCRVIDRDVTATTASGDLIVGRVGGAGQFTTASGDLIVDEVGGDLRVRTASGDAIVKATSASAEVRTASGDVRIGSVRSGTISVDTASGDIEIGVAAGVAAWLDVHSRSGRVSSDLETSAPPAGDDGTVSVVARTASGDVAVVRAPASAPDPVDRGA